MAKKQKKQKRESWPLLLDDARIVRAAGGIVYRYGADAVTLEVLLIHRPKQNDWSFPKGRVDGEEAIDDAAFREVLEETAYGCHLEEALPTVRYLDGSGRPKEAHYWKMSVLSEYPFVPNDEVDEVKWASVKEAFGLLTYKTDCMLLKAVSKTVSPTD